MNRIVLKGKKILLIGSSNDLDGRGMQEIIDGDTYDVICRVNKPYGKVEDVGERTDIVFFRTINRREKYWKKFDSVDFEQKPKWVSFSDGVRVKPHYDARIAKKYKLRMASTGLCAVLWLKEMGVASIDVIGFGVKNGVYDTKKRYTETNQLDTNPNFDWEKEHEITSPLVNFL